MDPAINVASPDASSLLPVSEYTNGDDGSLGDVDSLPESEPDSDTTSDLTLSEDEESDAEREWKESLQQLEMLLTMVIVPYAGKYFGRKFAYWGEYNSQVQLGFWSRSLCPDYPPGWAKFMEWKYPVKIEITNKALFRGAGAVEAAASL